MSLEVTNRIFRVSSINATYNLYWVDETDPKSFGARFESPFYDEGGIDHEGKKSNARGKDRQILDGNVIMEGHAT